RLVLQVVVQTESVPREVLADHGHAEVGAVLAAVLLRERVPVVAGGVGAAAHLDEQRLPLFVREAAPIPVRPGVLTAMVEESLVVVLGLERLDLPLDEVVQLGEVVDEVRREVEVHGRLRRSAGDPAASMVSGWDRSEDTSPAGKSSTNSERNDHGAPVGVQEGERRCRSIYRG